MKRYDIGYTPETDVNFFQYWIGANLIRFLAWIFRFDARVGTLRWRYNLHRIDQSNLTSYDESTI